MSPWQRAGLLTTLYKSSGFLELSDPQPRCKHTEWRHQHGLGWGSGVRQAEGLEGRPAVLPAVPWRRVQALEREWGRVGGAQQGFVDYGVCSLSCLPGLG